MVSLEAFVGPEGDERTAAFARGSALGRVLRERRMDVLRSLMTRVTLDTVSQENICCLNSALAVLLFAQRRRLLPRVLRAVGGEDPGATIDADKELLELWGAAAGDNASGAADAQQPLGTDSDAAFLGQGGPALSNYRRLLWFWRQYYLQSNEQDREALALSSRIPFADWLSVTDTLCADDGSDTSLLRRGQKLRTPTLLDLLTAS
jgi:hypothetical protein